MTPESHRFGLYRNILYGFALPIAVFDTAEEAADAMRAEAIASIPRINTVGDPRELALLILPLPRGIPETTP